MGQEERNLWALLRSPWEGTLCFPWYFFVDPIGWVFRLMVPLCYTHGIFEDQPIGRKMLGDGLPIGIESSPYGFSFHGFVSVPMGVVSAKISFQPIVCVSNPYICLQPISFMGPVSNPWDRNALIWV